MKIDQNWTKMDEKWSKLTLFRWFGDINFNQMWTKRQPWYQLFLTQSIKGPIWDLKMMKNRQSGEMVRWFGPGTHLYTGRMAWGGIKSRFGPGVHSHTGGEKIKFGAPFGVGTHLYTIQKWFIYISGKGLEVWNGTRCPFTHGFGEVVKGFEMASGTHLYTDVCKRDFTCTLVSIYTQGLR